MQRYCALNLVEHRGSDCRLTEGRAGRVLFPTLAVTGANVYSPGLTSSFNRRPTWTSNDPANRADVPSENETLSNNSNADMPLSSSETLDVVQRDDGEDEDTLTGGVEDGDIQTKGDQAVC